MVISRWFYLLTTSTILSSSGIDIFCESAEQVEEDATLVEDDVPTDEMLEQVIFFTHFQRRVREDPTQWSNLMKRLSTKHPALYEAIKPREAEFEVAMNSDRPAGSNSLPEDYVIVNRLTSRVLDYAVQDKRFLTYQWHHTKNQIWRYSPTGTFELPGFSKNEMRVLDVWTDNRADGSSHNGLMLYFHHEELNQRWVVTKGGSIISLHQNIVGEVLLLTVLSDGSVGVAPPVVPMDDSQRWDLYPLAELEQHEKRNRERAARKRGGKVDAFPD